MAIEVLDDILDSVHYTWNSLQKVVDEISKKWQELADSEALDPDADNSNFQFTVPQQYYATHYTSFTARSCTDAWNSYYNGYQEAGFCFELSLNDNVLNISNLTCLGKLVTAGGGQPEKWNYLNDTQKEQCLNDIKNYYEGQTIHIVNNYPDLPVIHSYGAYGSFIFKPTGKNYSDIYYKFNQYSGEVTSSRIQTQLANAAPYLDDSDDLIHGFSGGDLTQGIGNYYNGQPFEAVMDNLSDARNWVTTNGAINNYESSYLVFGGTMTVLYGDNYIIYVVPSGVKVNYNMMQEITKEVVTVINTDNPDKPPIDVPSYNDNKYGPPEPDPEEDPEWDEITSSGTYDNVARFVRSYYISGTELSNLKTWMGKSEQQGGPPNGYDFLDAIVGIKAYPWALADSATDTVTIFIPESDSLWVRFVESLSVVALAANLTGATVPTNLPATPTRTINSGISALATNCSMREYSLGTLDLAPYSNTEYPFLTYDTVIQLYIPYIGTFTLDTQAVMGKTLSCYLNLDPLTGGVYGYCMAGSTMICSGTGNIGVDVPISSAQLGIFLAQKDKIKQDAATSAVTAVASVAAPTMVAASAANSAAYQVASTVRGSISPQDLYTQTMASRQAAFAQYAPSAGQMYATATMGAANMLSAGREVARLGKSHGMAMTGSIGSSVADWSCPRDAYIKIMKPIVKDPGENYAHACAVPCYSSGTLSEFEGLTVCINPDVSNIDAATPAERNAIASILSGGVIV